MNEGLNTEMVHDHSFGQDQVRPGERKTRWVIALTAITMVVEIATGWLYGSMALLADGLHMASHAAALTIAAFAYYYARKHAHDRRFSFGTGKVNALGGFTGAVLLALFATLMAGESIRRLIHPVDIAFNQAILVAVLGLIVNGISVFILGDHHDHDHDHGHHPHADHNLRSAYLHVLADALTSVLAIFALLAGKYLSWNFMDPVMGIVGSVLVGRWSLGLLRDTSGVLLDVQAPDDVLGRVRQEIELEDDTQVTDLHIWSIGPGMFAAAITVQSGTALTPVEVRRRVPASAGIVHANIEIHYESGFP